MAAVLRASRGRGWYSKHLLASAIDEFYMKYNLYPAGMHSKLSCIEDWKEKMGLACARLAAWLNFESSVFAGVFKSKLCNFMVGWSLLRLVVSGIWSDGVALAKKLV